jgi:hypothetical protein
MANHLFIGLGGTGGKVLRELRKRVYEEFKSNEPTRGEAHIDYIYVDSNEDELNDRTGWKVLGKSVHLADTQKVSIHGINLSMLDNINMYPGIKAFLDSNDVALLRQKMDLVVKGIGGQRRRLGRTLLANNLASNDLNNDFNSRLKQTVKRLTDSSKEQSVTFHICAGLAGGTGSGTIVDIIYRSGNKKTIRAKDEGIPLDKPVVVLVNGTSASASEILSGALKDTHKATLVGNKTFGKGLVQKVVPLPNSTGINVTIARYLTPNGTDINKLGIKPDIEVGTDFDFIEDNKPDAQLEKAKEILNKR